MHTGRAAGCRFAPKCWHDGSGTRHAPAHTMIEIKQIKADMPVVCSEDGQFAVVDHMQGRDTIKLKKDKSGQHHYIPFSWVRSVDDKVHIDRPGDQAMKDWSTAPPSA